ncbi:MAG: hypothetical protein IPM54_44295 [Polyangiaceae bacterium]|nr:hypothetical protein [Polyangiaceae bacterium]
MTRFVRRFALMLSFAAASLFAIPMAHGSSAQASQEGEQAAQTSVKGAKAKTVSAAVRLVAKGIRLGNKHFGKIVSALDAAAAGPFLKHASKIADVLDDIASIPDVAERAVGENCFTLCVINMAFSS